MLEMSYDIDRYRRAGCAPTCKRGSMSKISSVGSESTGRSDVGDADIDPTLTEGRPKFENLVFKAAESVVPKASG